MFGLWPGTLACLPTCSWRKDARFASFVFSDSRQDAAKLSAGIPFAHYRDALRQALAIALRNQRRGVEAFWKQVTGQPLSPDEQTDAAVFAAQRPTDALALGMAVNPAISNMPSTTNPQHTWQVIAQRIRNRAANGPFPIAPLTHDAAGQLLRCGMNPGGWSQEVLWTDSQNQQGHWRELFIWPTGGTPAEQPQHLLSAAQQSHLQRIHRQSEIEVMDILFASGRRSLESLRLAYVTTDRIAHPAPNPLVQEAWTALSGFSVRGASWRQRMETVLRVSPATCASTLRR